MRDLLDVSVSEESGSDRIKRAIGSDYHSVTLLDESKTTDSRANAAQSARVEGRFSME